MASGGRLCSNEDSSSITRPDDSEDDFEANFDLQFLTAGQISPGPPLDGSIVKSPKGGQEQDCVVSQIKKEEPMMPWKFSKAECIELLDSEQIPLVTPIKKEELMKSWKFTEAERIELLDSEQIPLVTPIKKDEPMTSWKFTEGECIEILDSEQIPLVIPIKKEKPEAPWKFSKSDFVELSDSEDGVLCQNQLPVNSSIQDTNKGNNNVLKMHHFQKMLAERALGKPLAEGANQLFNKLQTSHPQTSETDAVDPNSWMSATTVDSDVDPGATFAAAKKEYEKKLRAGKADEVDEIYFTKAKMAEEGRLNRLRIDHPSSGETVPISEGIDEESDGDLFVAQEATASRKRPHTMTMGDGEGDGLEDKDGGSTGNPTSKRAKPMSKKKHANHAESELEASMLAGIEDVLANCEKTGGQNQTTTKTPNDRKTHGKDAEASKGKATQRNSRRKKEARKKGKAKMPAHLTDDSLKDCLNDINSLLHSNFSEEANNNIGSRELPTVTSKDKQKALTALLASVPLEERGSIRGERSQILQNIKTLSTHRVRADGAGRWKMKGMKSSLHHHQIQGAAWMHERETGTVQPLGGLQADQMGFGKTVMMIATMLANPPGPNDSKCTLIVCTPAIITQWIDEIAAHVERGILPQVIRYQASTSMVTFGRNLESAISNADVVLTTYQEVVRSYPRYSSYSPPKRLTTAEQMKIWWQPVYQKRRGLLHKINFFRVVLDEAQAIKNHKSYTSIACRALMSKHRWALSGTPIYNTVEELYPYFKFLRVKHIGDFDGFKTKFCNFKNPDSVRRLHVFLKQVMVRRTHKDKLFGAPIVPMPHNTQVTHVIEFNSVERAIYEAFKHRSIEFINYSSRAGTLEKSYRNVLTMLLRLRQLTGHPFMLRGIIESLFKLHEVQRMEETYASEVNEDQKDMLSTMRKMIQAHETPIQVTEDATVEPLDSNSQGEEDDDDEYPSFVVRFRKSLRELANDSKWTELNNRSLCHRCKDQPDAPWVTDCEHLYCYECLMSLEFETKEKGEPLNACLECGHNFIISHPCRGIEELDLHKDTTLTTAKSFKKRPKQKDPDEDIIKWINLEGKILPSAKVSAVQAQIEKWLQEDPKKKIIIFSQFYTLMKILEILCQQKKWGYCRYDGKMTLLARDKAIENFRVKPDIMIMVASLKCGGIGLNLTMASRVICVDLWWNDSVEQQAFCRVFRIGQDSETFVTRFVVKGTVDEKLQDMQRVKAEKIGAAIDDPKMLGKLTLDELLRLFGPVVLDANGKPFIVVENHEAGGPTPQRAPFPTAITESGDSE